MGDRDSPPKTADPACIISAAVAKLWPSSRGDVFARSRLIANMMVAMDSHADPVADFDPLLYGGVVDSVVFVQNWDPDAENIPRLVAFCAAVAKAVCASNAGWIDGKLGEFRHTIPLELYGRVFTQTSPEVWHTLDAEAQDKIQNITLSCCHGLAAGYRSLLDMFVLKVIHHRTTVKSLQELVKSVVYTRQTQEQLALALDLARVDADDLRMALTHSRAKVSRLTATERAQQSALAPLKPPPPTRPPRGYPKD